MDDLKMPKEEFLFEILKKLARKFKDLREENHVLKALIKTKDDEITFLKKMVTILDDEAKARK